MTFTIHGDRTALAQAINAFNPRYHADYLVVRVAARGYLEKALTPATALALAGPLLAALHSWDAGKRRAPRCRSLANVAHALCDPLLHSSLQYLSLSFGYLDIVDGRRVLRPGGPFPTVIAFDRGVIAALNTLADVLLAANTNVTYPMTALLLVTGLAPAFDRQVRRGLGIAGLTGMTNNQFLLPRGDDSGALKICTLPFYIAHCVAHARRELDAGIALSRYPVLEGEYGRIFDVLLFEQRRRTPHTTLLRFCTEASRRWYNIGACDVPVPGP